MKKAALLLVLLLSLAYFAFSFRIADTLSIPSPSPLDAAAHVVSPRFEKVEFKATDGVLLKGWLFKDTSHKLIIFVPGLSQNRLNKDYSGVNIAKELISQGYSVLMYDPRGSGESQKTRVGFGSTEGRDIIGAVQFAKQKGFAPQKIGIIADSLGAIATLNFIDKLKDVGAIVLDSPATAIQPLVERSLKKDHNIPSIFFPGIFLMGKLFLGIDIPSVRPIDRIRLVPERVFLFLHGAKDTLIPFKESQKLLKYANKKSKLIIFDNADHVHTYKSDPELYRKEVFGFLQQKLGQ